MTEPQPQPETPLTVEYTEMVKRNVKRWRDEQERRQQKEIEWEAKHGKPVPNRIQL